MTKPQIDYIVANGQHAINYLQDLSNTLTGREECNRVFNHGVAVAQLIEAVKQLYSANETLKSSLAIESEAVRELRRGDFERQLNDHMVIMKESLIDLIKQYPNIDY